MWSNDIKCKYMFMFPLKNLARKGLSNQSDIHNPNCLLNPVRCHYNAVSFLQTIHVRRPIARPSGRAMGCLLWVQPLINILPQFLQS